MNVRLALTAAVTALAFAPGSAFAQGAATPMAAAYPEPPPPPPLGFRFHDGFYLRLAIGPMFVRDVERQGGVDLDVIHGAGTALELMIGGAPTPGLIVGGGLVGGIAGAPGVSGGEGASPIRSDTSLGIATVGPFVDWYVHPRRGFHLQALAGLGRVTLSNRPEYAGHNLRAANGVGFALGVGNEWWVGDQWGIGLLGRIDHVAARAEADTISYSHAATMASLLFTVTYQ